VRHLADLRLFAARRRQYLFDAGLAVVLVLASLRTFDAWHHRAPAYSAMIVAGLLIQHRWPVQALALASAGAGMQQFYSYGDLRPIHFGPVITLYVLTRQARRRWIPAAALAVLLAAAYLLSVRHVAQSADPEVDAKWLAAYAKSPDVAESIRAKVAASPPQSTGAQLDTAFGEAFGFMLLLVLAFAVAIAVRTRLAHRRTLGQRAADLSREQRQREALAAAAERARIARELHDVVAHSLAVIVAQAQAAAAAQRRHPERTTQALQEVITVGRGSLAEMRRLLGAVRPGPDGDPALAPESGIGALPALIDRVRAAGTPVRLEVDGAPGPLPTAVDLSAYRIVQEALTNTLKHAGAGATASVRLAFRPGHVDIEVVDDGAGRPADAPAGHGNGLRGIAERVGLLGGELTVGPVPAGGFQVRARLPIEPEQIGAPA
jgi:signal transduction histidine kinase